MGLLALLASAVVALVSGGLYAGLLMQPILVVAGVALWLRRRTTALAAIMAAALTSASLPLGVLDWQTWALAAGLTVSIDANLARGRDPVQAWRTSTLVVLALLLLFAAVWLFRPAHASLFAPDATDASTLFLGALGAIMALLVTAGPLTPPEPTPPRRTDDKP